MKKSYHLNHLSVFLGHALSSQVQCIPWFILAAKHDGDQLRLSVTLVSWSIPPPAAHKNAHEMNCAGPLGNEAQWPWDLNNDQAAMKIQWVGENHFRDLTIWPITHDCSLTNHSRHLYILYIHLISKFPEMGVPPVITTIWLFNSSPWKIHPFLRTVNTIYFYRPSIPWQTVSHNQKVSLTTMNGEWWWIMVV